jgi:N-dimethylarginine dimethylaminohydrolase
MGVVTMPTGSNPPVFLVSPPRLDWTIRGRANVFAKDVEAPSADAARADWWAVCTAVEAAGGVCAVVDNESDPSLTGLPYTAEAGVCGVDPDSGDRVFVLPRLTPPHRRAEPAIIGPAVARLGLVTVELPEDSAFEGQGDVIKIADRFVCTAGVGPWARTHVDSLDAVVDVLPGRWLKLAFHADPWFHGNTFLGAWSRGSDVVVAVCPEALRDDGAALLSAFVDGARVVPLSKDETLTYATNALQVNDTVLAPAGVPGHVVDAWRSIGLAVHFLELPALFRKGGGAAVCLTNRLDGVTVDDVPAEMRLQAWMARQ